MDFVGDLNCKNKGKLIDVKLIKMHISYQWVKADDDAMKTKRFGCVSIRPTQELKKKECIPKLSLYIYIYKQKALVVFLLDISKNLWKECTKPFLYIHILHKCIWII